MFHAHVNQTVLVLCKWARPPAVSRCALRLKMLEHFLLQEALHGQRIPTPCNAERIHPVIVSVMSCHVQITLAALPAPCSSARSADIDRHNMWLPNGGADR